MKKRVLFIDVLRLIAIFGVVIIHVSSENMLGTKITNYILVNNFMNGLVHSFSVPMFVTISGYLLLGKKKINYVTMIKKYLFRILICLVFWHYIYYFFQFRSLNISLFISASKSLIIGNTYSHLWYLYLIIGLYLITPILNKLVIVLKKKDFIYLLSLGFFITSFLPTINNYSSFDINKLILPYKVFSFNIFVFYYLLGYYLRKYGFKHYKILFAISIIMFFVMICYSNYVSIKSGRLVNYLDYSNIVGLFFVISLFSGLRHLLIKKSNKFIGELGCLTFGVYLIHFFIEKLLLHFGVNSNVIYPVFGNILVSLLILVISYIICYFLSKIPYIRNFIL